MLMERHLAVIQAALKYWDEEMSPHGDGMFAGYLDESHQDIDVTTTDVNSALSLLSQSELRFALIEERTGKLINQDLISATDAMEASSLNDDLLVASVLVPNQSTD